jgi:multidrug resistance protein MdtO
MATIVQSVPAPPRPWAWFGEFLRAELAPYPGRTGTVARMVIAATLVMIICMTFRLSYAFEGAIFTIIISRESPRATLQSAGTMFLFYGIGAAYLLISASLVISVPMLHFVWIVCSLFVAFFALSTIRNYGAAVIFAIVIAVGVPLWDRQLPAHVNAEDTLRLTLAVLIGAAVSALVELAFSRRRPGDEIVLPIAHRLAAVQALLASYREGHTADQATVDEITRYAMLGTSRLRPLLRRSDYSRRYRSEMNSVTVLVGWLVDTAATLPGLSVRPSSNDQKQLRDLAAAIAGIRSDLMNRRIPGPIHFNPDGKAAFGLPLLAEMEKIVELIPQAFADSLSIPLPALPRPFDEYRPRPEETRPLELLVPDAFTNPDHFKFALGGCLAASLCYIFYTSVNWPDISTALVTCALTALTTIGGSRQKQVLRFAGISVGGFLFGMGSQIFILPHIDSIAGFTVLFILVTAVSSWFSTSSPRLSYFGVMIALAFYLINLQEFAFQTSLLVARDRVIGTLLGVLMMWLVFDQLWSAPAAVEMKRTFISNLRALARLVREPLPGKEKAWDGYALRETISANFGNVRGLADGVLFEFGPSRQRNLALRDRIRRWQSQLRIVFLTRIALLKYRLQVPGFELPEAVRAAQLEFDNRLAQTLDGMADRLEGKRSEIRENLQESAERLEQTTSTCCSELPKEALTAPLSAFLPLSRRMESLTSALDREI